MIARYVELFRAVRGRDPIVDGKDAGDAQTLLRRLGGRIDDALEALETAFADPWWRARVTLAQIAKDPNRFRGDEARDRGPDRDGWAPLLACAPTPIRSPASPLRPSPLPASPSPPPAGVDILGPLLAGAGGLHGTA